MLKHLTRAKLIQLWFVIVALVAVASIAFGLSMTIGTWLLLFAMSLVPPAIVVLLWPGAQPPTAAEVLRGTDPRS